MNRSVSRFLIVAIFAAAGSIPASAQPPAATLSRLASPVDTVRVHAFYALVAKANADAGARVGELRPGVLAARAKRDPQLASALIALLRRENQLMRTSSPPSASIDPEDMMSYRLDLSGAVAAMGDPRSVNDLLPWVSTGGIIRDALISFGEVSVPGLVATLADTAWTQRMAAALDLGRIAADTAQLLSASARAAIRAGLLRVLSNEPKLQVRQDAVGALATFSDDEVRSTMERLAASDTAECSFCRSRYPVREAAKAWLAKHPK